MTIPNIYCSIWKTNILELLIAFFRQWSRRMSILENKYFGTSDWHLTYCVLPEMIMTNVYFGKQIFWKFWLTSYLLRSYGNGHDECSFWKINIGELLTDILHNAFFRQCSSRMFIFEHLPDILLTMLTCYVQPKVIMNI